MEGTLSNQMFIQAAAQDRTQLDGKQIFIVGMRRFQNDLLVHYLEEETGASCQSREEIHQIPPGVDRDIIPQRQILCDSMGRDPTLTLAELHSCARALLTRDLVVVFNLPPHSGIEQEGIQMGVRGFFYESDPLHIFVKGIQSIFHGELRLSRELMEKCIFPEAEQVHLNGNEPCLTRRENEILSMLVVGSTNDQIAERLGISPHTVKTHIYNIFKKINVPNRLQAALWAAKHLC